VEIPQLVWQPILRGIVLRTRPKKSAHAYQQVWTPAGSPLAAITAAQAKALEGAFGESVRIDYAMRYGQPAIGERIPRHEGGRLHPHPARAALSPILRRHDRDRQ
jgi:ferrochelatase